MELDISSKDTKIRLSKKTPKLKTSQDNTNINLDSDINVCSKPITTKINLGGTSVVTGDKNFLFIQNIALDRWEINHNLEKYPSVSVIDSAGNEVIGDVEYIDINNLVITFKGAFKGKATLN